MHEAVVQFLDGVCAKVRCRAVHRDIRDELAGHIEEAAAAYQADGMDTEAAVQQAVRQMGNCDEIGTQLDKKHRPRIDWLTLLFMALFVVVGALVMAVCSRGYAKRMGMDEWYYFQRFLFYMPIGVAALAAATFLDYTRLQKYPWLWLAAGAALFVLARLFGAWNGGRYYFVIGPLSVSPMHIAPVLFLIGFAGLLERYRGGGGLELAKLCAAAAGTLLFLIGYSCLGNAVVLALAYAVLLVAAVWRGQFRGRRQAYFAVFAGMLIFVVLAVLALCLVRPYWAARLTEWIGWGASGDARGNGWMYQQMRNALSASQWVGPYMLSVTPDFILPEAHTDVVWIMLIANAGILAGIGVAALCGLLVTRMAVTAHRTQQGFGHYLSLGICGLIGAKYLLNLMGCLNLLPLFGVGLPFLSYGGSDYIANMAAVGLSLSVWRRGRILPAAAAPAARPSGKFVTVQDGQIIIKWK